jgi:XTP/dITP diphosphohydrolase
MTLVFATHNPNKAKEIEQILGPGFQIKTLNDIGCTEEIAETADTLEGNALLKARYVLENYGLPCFSEDTGLEVEALGGAPGVHTARYAGESRDPEANIALLLQNLADKSSRKAQFRTIIALVGHDHEQLMEGICRGEIATEKRGTGGFGYDPVFVPEGYEETFAQLGDSVKNSISHRGRATQRLIAQLKEGFVF